MDYARDLYYRWGAEAYVQNNFIFYREKWSASPEQKWYAGWNWAGFFLGYTWALYRKMYLHALLTFAVTLLLPLGMARLAAALVFGIFGNGMYRKKAMQAVNDGVYLHGTNEQAVRQYLTGKGGTSLAAALALEIMAVLLLFI